MAITKEKKEALVQEYVELLNDSQAIVFVRSRGLSVAEVTTLRNGVREAGGTYVVIKNTLFRLALDKAEMPIPEAIGGPIAVTFCPEDLASAVKAVSDFAQEVEGREFEIVGGIIDGTVLNADGASALASLPTRDTLFAQILTGMNAPASQLVGIMANGLRQVLNVLQARVDQLQESEAAA